MKGTSVPMMPSDKPRSSMSVRLHSKHGGMMPKNAKIGGKHSVRIVGRIAGLRSDEYGHSFDMDLDSMEHDSDADQEKEPKSLSGAMKHRKRHMASGRFTA